MFTAIVQVYKQFVSGSYRCPRRRGFRKVPINYFGTCTASKKSYAHLAICDIKTLRTKFNATRKQETTEKKKKNRRKALIKENFKWKNLANVGPSANKT